MENLSNHTIQPVCRFHYSDVTKTIMASQITYPHFLCNRLLKLTSKKTSKPALLALCGEFTGEFPARGASNAEDVSICWRHHATNPACILSSLTVSVCLYGTRKSRQSRNYSWTLYEIILYLVYITRCLDLILVYTAMVNMTGWICVAQWATVL